MEKFLHTYQRTLDKGVFLYRIQERLMLYTIISVTAKKRKVNVCALAFMFTHIHSLLRVSSRRDAHDFWGEAISIFVRELNRDSGRKGAMFDSIGSAWKTGDKKIRSCILYIYNNSCEKKLFRRAIDDRWNFLSYAFSHNPFSKKLILRNSSAGMRAALKMVNFEEQNGRYLNLPRLRTIFSGLNKEETQQLMDYIICRYDMIDYQSTVKYFKSPDSMLMAIDSGTGKEFDIKEEWDGDSEIPFVHLCSKAREFGLLDRDMKIYNSSPERRAELKEVFLLETDAQSYQIDKFLHLQ